MKPPVFSNDWTEEVKAIYRHDRQEMWDDSIAPHIWNQYHNQLSCYIDIAGSNTKKILDVGCAQATLSLLLAEKGHSVTAVDLRPEFLEYARLRYTHGDIQFLTANILNEDIPGKYDLIFANQLIEHLVYPEQLISRLKCHLNVGGKLVVTTPNFDYFRNSLPSFSQLGDPKEWEHLQFSADGDGHFYAYSSNEVIDVFRDCKFKDVEHRYFESPFISGRHIGFRQMPTYMSHKILKSVDKLLVGFPLFGKYTAFQLLVTGTSI